MILMMMVYRSSRVLSLMTNDDPRLENPNEPPKLTLKPLPSGLEYAFFRDNEISLVVIPSSLAEQQEEKLLDGLRKHRKAFG